MWPNMVTHTRNWCSAFNPSKCTHTAVSSEQTHTHRKHIQSSGHVCCGARGAVGGSVSCSRVSPQSWYWRWRERWIFTPPPTIPARPETRTHDLCVTSPTLYQLGHECLFNSIICNSIQYNQFNVLAIEKNIKCFLRSKTQDSKCIIQKLKINFRMISKGSCNTKHSTLPL